jgi:hypothetical protein
MIQPATRALVLVDAGFFASTGFMSERLTVSFLTCNSLTSHHYGNNDHSSLLHHARQLFWRASRRPAPSGSGYRDMS